MKQDSADFCRNAKGSVDQTVLQNSTTGMKKIDVIINRMKGGADLIDD